MRRLWLSSLRGCLLPLLLVASGGAYGAPTSSVDLVMTDGVNLRTDIYAMEGDPAPVVVAEQQTALREMTVGAAVLQLDLAEAPAIVFKNAAHGGLNVVYRRRDGNIGWIDPSR